MSKYKDFDSFFNETKKEPIKFTLYGQEWELPAQLSLKTTIQLTKVSKTEDFEAALEVIKLLLGNSQYERLLEGDIKVDELKQLTEWISQQYNPNSNIKLDEKK